MTATRKQHSTKRRMKRNQAAAQPKAAEVLGKNGEKMVSVLFVPASGLGEKWCQFSFCLLEKGKNGEKWCQIRMALRLSPPELTATYATTQVAYRTFRRHSS